MIKSCPCYVIISAIVLLIVLLLIYLFCCCRKCKNVLSERQQNIVLISGFTARGDLKGLKCALNSALNSGMKINEINEILIQMEKLCLISWKSGRLLMLQESGRDRIAAI